uniref:Copine-5-like n=1 Tax=Sinocyclocheilus grahami TaxID=75366 RepID=A0A672SGR0_SINGR
MYTALFEFNFFVFLFLRFTICHKTEVVKNTLNPVWQPFTIPVRALCNGDYDRSIKVEVYDWDRDGSHDFIGEFTTSYRELSRGQSQFNVFEVVNPKKKLKKRRYINSGTVTLLSFSVEAEHTFLDYIKAGTQIHFTVAIDFTASNGNPSQSTSLHYMSPYQMNAYAMAGLPRESEDCPALRTHQFCSCHQPCSKVRKMQQHSLKGACWHS